MDKLSLWSIAVLAALPALLCACFIKNYAVNVVFWDEWLVAIDLDKFYSGTLTSADLFAQHNEHRIFFPRLLMLAIGHWTGFDTRACMWTTWVMLCLLAATLYSMLRSTAADRRSDLIRFLPISWFVFNWRQHENLLWGFQVQIALMTLCLVCTAHWLDKSERIDRAFWLAAISGMIGSFSFANGLLIWPIGLLQIIGQRYLDEQRVKKLFGWQARIWSLAGLAVYLLYFWKYQKPPHHPSLLLFFKDFIAAIKYFLVYWGSPLAGEMRNALAAGLILLAVSGYSMFVLLFRQRMPKSSLKFFSLTLFAALSGATLVVSRLGFGVEQALSSRYVTLSSCGLIGCFALTQLVESEPRKRGLQCFLAGLVLFGAITSYLNEGNEGQRRWAESGERAFILRSYRCQPDTRLQALHPTPDLVRHYALILEKHRLNVFHEGQKIDCDPGRKVEEPLSKPDSTDYFIDAINQFLGENLTGELTIDAAKEQSLMLKGWAIDRQSGGPAAGVLVNVDGQRDFPADYGGERMDVALHFNRPAYWHSGFVASLPVAELGPGKHTVRLKIITSDRQQYYQSEPVIVAVTP